MSDMDSGELVRGRGSGHSPSDRRQALLVAGGCDQNAKLAQAAAWQAMIGIARSSPGRPHELLRSATQGG